MKELRNIYITGVSAIRPGEYWNRSLEDMSYTVVEEALLDAGNPQLDALFIANTLAGGLDTMAIGLDLPTHNVSGCAAGGLAIHAAINGILAGEIDTAMILGAEKMTDHSALELATALMSPASIEEQLQGFTQPALYAIIATKHMEEYGTTRDQLSAVAVQNHNHATLNPNAQFRRPITIEQVNRSHKIADPLRVLDCSPISDGAAALIISSENTSNRAVRISASSVGSDTAGLDKRENILKMRATQKATQRVYEQADVEPGDLDVVELHDGFTIGEIIALEDLGLFPEGQAATEIALGKTALGQNLVVNPSGGLKACGNPVGATGVYQAFEIVTQLRGEAGDRQVPNARIGLTHNISGTGVTAVVHIFEKMVR